MGYSFRITASVLVYAPSHRQDNTYHSLGTKKNKKNIYIQVSTYKFVQIEAVEKTISFLLVEQPVDHDNKIFLHSLDHDVMPQMVVKETACLNHRPATTRLGGTYHKELEREREMFYLTTHSTHFIYGYMVSDIWLRTILIVRKETSCCHIDYSYRLTASVLLYAPFHRQDNTYHCLCYTSHGALTGTRNSSFLNLSDKILPKQMWHKQILLSWLII